MTWKNVKSDGYPPCDGKTIYMGIGRKYHNSVNDEHPDFFNDYFHAGIKCPDGKPICIYESEGGVNLTIHDLKWWQELELPK